MATVDDIDTKAYVEKFLSRDILTPQTDDALDTGEEVQALLESIATTFLLFPQAILPITLRAKNSLRQVAAVDLQAVDFLIKAVGEVTNPNPVITDTSDLIEAQTALLELDRLGRVSEDLQAYSRYEAALSRFLEVELAPSLKRRATKEFERSGLEAQQDVFTVLPDFLATHRVMADNLSYLASAVSDFQSVDLNKMVSSKTISKIRDSLRTVQYRIDNNGISLTVAAIELLAGSSSMKSISDNIEVYAPTIETGELPTNRTIYLRPEAAQATMESGDGPWVATNSTDRWLAITVNPLEAIGSTAVELPYPGVEDSSGNNTYYVTSSPDTAASSYEIPVDSRLYVRIDGYGGDGGEEGEWEVPFPAGTYSVQDILDIINDSTDGLWFGGVQRAGAVEFKDGRFAIYVIDPGLPTSLVIRPSSSGLLPIGAPEYNADPSVHELLGFSANQSSPAPGEWTAESLKDALDDRLPGATMTVDGDKLQITSDSSEDTSSLSVATHANGIEDVLDFPTYVQSEPGYAELTEDSAALDPAAEGVFVGSIVTAVEADLANPPYPSAVRTLNNEAVTSIVGTKLYFASSPLPRGDALDVEVVAPVVEGVQSLTVSTSRLDGEFDEDFDDIQQALVPVATKPTPAQINDALRVLNGIREKLTNGNGTGILDVLDAVVVRPDRSQYSSLSEKVIKSLEERGLDRAVDLISSGRFSDFFSLNKSVASRSTRIMRAMEESMSNDVPVSYIEEDVDQDARFTGSSRDDVILDRELTTSSPLIRDGG